MNRVMIFAVLAVIALSLILTVAEMPPFGELQVPANEGPAAHYLLHARDETKALNIISAILVDYRAYDTLIETTVLFTATAAMLALSQGKKKGE